MPDFHFQISVVPVLLQNTGAGIFLGDEFLDAPVDHSAASSAAGITAIATYRGHSTVSIHIHLDVIIPVLQLKTVELTFRCLVEIHVINPIVTVLRSPEITHDVIGNLTRMQLCTGKHPVLGGVEKKLAAYLAAVLVHIDYLHFRHAVLDIYIHYSGIGIMGLDEIPNTA